MLHENQFLEQITTLKMKHFLNFEVLGNVGVEALERPKAVAVSATQQIPPNTDQAKESNPGGYNIICKHTAEMHIVAYLGQNNLKQMTKT